MVNWKSSLIDFYKTRAKIQSLVELTAVQDLQAKATENQRNSEAEAAHARRVAWGAKDEPVEDDMATTVLGDITTNHPAPIIMQAASSPLLPIALSLLGFGAGAVVASYLIDNKAPAPVEQTIPEFDDETVSIGLGRIEDYITDTN